MNAVVLLTSLISLLGGADCVVNRLVLRSALPLLAWFGRGLPLCLWQLVVSELDRDCLDEPLDPLLIVILLELLLQLLLHLPEFRAPLRRLHVAVLLAE